jgi:putative peptidoglycan lipid II flippase
MKHILNRRSIIKHTMQLGISTMLSKALGFIRELLMARYLGVGPLADAFFTAFRIPNSLRKIFAEGALSAAFVPTLTQVITHDGQEEASKITSLAFIIIQSVLFILCGIFAYTAPFFIAFQAPGWLANGSDSERFVVAVVLFKIVIFYIMFISASSLFAGALQGINRFGIAAWGQIVSNIVWIVQLFICSYYNVTLVAFSWLILLNGLLYALVHYGAYYLAGFRFIFAWNEKTKKSVYHVLKKFFPCALGYGAIEINLYIDQIVASYLPEGSLSLLNYTQGFMRLPLGMFAVALATILLPHFSRVSRYAPRRLGYYVLESTKLIFWVTIPATLLITFFSYDIFYTTYYSFSDKFALEYVQEASILLIISVLGLFFFSLNKVIINIYYALHETRWPTVITIIATICNTVLNIIGIELLGLKGIVLATTIAAIIQSILFIVVLQKHMKLPLYLPAFWNFCVRYGVHVTLASLLFYGIYKGSYFLITLLGPWSQYLLLQTMLYWIWVGPLCGLFMLFLYSTRHWFKIKIHFLD